MLPLQDQLEIYFPAKGIVRSKKRFIKNKTKQNRKCSSAISNKNNYASLSNYVIKLACFICFPAVIKPCFEHFCQSILPSHTAYKGDNVNTECNHESAIHNSGNSHHGLVGFFEGWGIFRFQMGNEEKKTLQTYAAAETMKS